MARRKIEMHQYRQALLRLRQGDSDRQVAATKLLGRRAVAALRILALERDWLTRVRHQTEFLTAPLQ